MSSLTSVQPSSRTVLATESGDKLGDLVDKLEKVKVNGNEDEANIGAPERYIKHPLQNAWTLWFFKNDKSRTWEENQVILRPLHNLFKLLLSICSAANHHRNHSGGLLESLQPHRGCQQAASGSRLLHVQGGHLSR